MPGGQLQHRPDKRKPWLVYYYDGGRRRSRSFRRKIDAEEFAKEQRLPDDLRLTAEERLQVVAARRSRYVVSVTVAEARDRYLEHCRSRNLREATVEQYRRQTAKLRDDVLVSDVTRDDVLALVLRHDVESTRRMVAAHILPWLRWCQRQGWCTGWDAPLAWDRRREDDRTVEILTPDQLRQVFAALPAHYHAAIALMAFAGLRPEEVVPYRPGRETVLWSDIDRARACVRLRGAVTKTRDATVLHDLPPVLWAWLSGGDEGPVCPVRMRAFRRARAQALSPWPKDCLRHSFASYGWHILGIERTMEVMRHRNPRTFFRHYKGAASDVDAHEWFTILPKNFENRIKKPLPDGRG